MYILLAEDDAFFRELISHSLSKLGHEIVFAENGDDALQKLQLGQFDLLITDIFMPDKEGIEVIQEVRDLGLHIKILVISSGGLAGHSSFLKIAEGVGADASLQKPFTPEQLAEKSARWNPWNR